MVFTTGFWFYSRFMRFPLVFSDSIDQICCSWKHFSTTKWFNAFSQNQTSQKQTRRIAKYVESILKYIEFGGEWIVQGKISFIVLDPFYVIRKINFNMPIPKTFFLGAEKL